jgi:hypothetical protein
MMMRDLDQRNGVEEPEETALRIRTQLTPKLTGEVEGWGCVYHSIGSHASNLVFGFHISIPGVLSQCS